MDIACTRSGCVEMFESSDAMKMHRGIVHEYKFACVNCPENYFKKKGGLEDHIERAHKIDYQNRRGEIDGGIARMEKAMARVARNK